MISNNPLNSEWESAHTNLLQNIKKHPFVSQFENSVHTNIAGKEVYLPAYVPYIGPRYFNYRPRILCYAINQNLSPHVPWSQDWIEHYARDIEFAQDRLNRSVHEGRQIPIRPYAEGFIPLVSLIAILRWISIFGGYLPRFVDEVVSVTNFIKFSTSNDASSSSIPKIWWRECGATYVQNEIRELHPDVILCFGQRTVEEVIYVLEQIGLQKYSPKLLKCRFPARLTSIKSRKLNKSELLIWNLKILPLVNKILKPKYNSYHKCKIHQYPGYFTDTMSSWESHF